MGGGGGKAPEPKKFESPALQDGPAKNPIPNFFGGGQRGQTPYEAMSALQSVIDVADGRVPTHVLNRDALDHPRFASLSRTPSARKAGQS